MYYSTAFTFIHYKSSTAAICRSFFKSKPLKNDEKSGQVDHLDSAATFQLDFSVAHSVPMACY